MKAFSRLLQVLPRRNRAAPRSRLVNVRWLATCSALGVVVLLSTLKSAAAQSQAFSGEWSEPYRLSTNAGKASEGYLVTDQYGYVHCFWTETLFAEQRTAIQYSRFDGTAWSTPNAIYVTGADINGISPAVDEHGTLHVMWTGGLSGPAYYTHAPAHDAIPAQNWSPPLRIDIPSNSLKLQVDSNGLFHLLYINRGAEPGVYYVRSEDEGMSWSEPSWLDPDILAGHIPASLTFVHGERDDLHAVWFYGALDADFQPDWVRYAHSLDGGHTWSAPFLVDQAVPESDHNLTVAGPIMTVQGQTVHVIWAAGSLPYRQHRVSTDNGLTWSAPRQIFGELHGQAGDGFTVDGAGRVHFLSQVRYPIGIYHALWDEDVWTSPTLVYLVAEADEAIGDRIHAHALSPVVRAGNQLIVTFTDGPADPNRRLFAIHRTLDDIPSASTIAAPTAAPTSIVLISPPPPQSTPQPTLTARAPLPSEDVGQPAALANPALTLRAALAPAIFLLGATVAYRLIRKLKRSPASE